MDTGRHPYLFTNALANGPRERNNNQILALMQTCIISFWIKSMENVDKSSYGCNVKVETKLPGNSGDTYQISLPEPYVTPAMREAIHDVALFEALKSFEIFTKNSPKVYATPSANNKNGTLVKEG